MKPRHFALGLAVLLIAGLGVGASRTATPTIDYVTAPVARGDVRTTLTATGSLKSVETVSVGSELSGQLAEVLVDFNDTVRRGQPIARLDPSGFAADVREAEATLEIAVADRTIARAAVRRARFALDGARSGREVAAAEAESARARAANAERELARARTLFTGGTLAEAFVDDALADYRSTTALERAAEAERTGRHRAALTAEADLRMAEAELQRAEAVVRQQTAVLERTRLDLERTVIRAPIDGLVIGRDVEAGQTVAASFEAPTLFTIARDLEAMEVHAMIDEADIGRIRTGQRAVFAVDAHPARTFAGSVADVRLAPNVVQNVVTYDVLITAENADRALLPGMTATVEIVVDAVDDVLTVPNAALRFEPPAEAAATPPPSPTTPGGGGATVWRLDRDGAPRPVVVTVGASDARATAIVGGPLRAGDAVVVATTGAPARRSWLARLFAGPG
jgi:HlyD family secretion protein